MASTKKQAKPHVVVVPHPSFGHVHPALQLSQMLHHHGVFVTFVSTEHNHRSAQLAAPAGDGFQLETIHDGLADADRHGGGGGTMDYDRALSKSTSKRCAAPLRELVARLRGGNGSVPPVTCVMPTALMSFAPDVARELELGVPSMVFWVTPPASLLGQMSLRQLRERGYVPLRDERFLTNGYLDETIIDWIPGMPPICLGDVSSFVRTADPDDFSLCFNDTEANGCTRAGALVLNTFDALDADGLAALRAKFPRVYSIGPLCLLLRRQLQLQLHRDDQTTTTTIDLSPWKQDTACLAWLDAQEPGSVTYANFGSLNALTAEQLAEFAWGLADTGRPFLWVVREDLLVSGGGLAALPPEFLSATAERGYVTTWCPQERVLRHRGVGCFLTHGGSNCKYACEVWGVGLRLRAEVTREQVTGQIRSVMDSSSLQGVGIRARAAAWKAEAEKAVCPGGTSYQSLMDMLKELRVGALELDRTLAESAHGVLELASA